MLPKNCRERERKYVEKNNPTAQRGVIAQLSSITSLAASLVRRCLNARYRHLSFSLLLGRRL